MNLNLPRNPPAVSKEPRWFRPLYAFRLHDYRSRPMPRQQQRMTPKSSPQMTLGAKVSLGLLALGTALLLAWILLGQPDDENDPPLHPPATTAAGKSVDTTTAPR